MIAHAILSTDMDKRGHFSYDISLEDDDDFQGNDMCNDWAEILCEYNIDDQLEVCLTLV